MSRFFTEGGRDCLTLSQEDIKHIYSVLRMTPGDMITVCDEGLSVYECEILTVNKDSISLKILKESKPEEPRVKITLYQGLLKQDKMEYLIQKAVELGIYSIVPFECQRAVARIKEGGEKKILRWQKIAHAAAKQCGRGVVPKIHSPVNFKSLIGQIADKPSALSLIPYELEKSARLKSAMEGFTGNEISVIIGPEGGFSEDEVRLAAGAGIVPVTLGCRILRAETAGIAVIAAIMYHIGEL